MSRSYLPPLAYEVARRTVCAPSNREPLGDVHLLLIRDRGSGGEVLMLRRANTGYEDGNEPGELATAAMVREAAEETGILIHPDDLELVHVMHRRGVGMDCTNSERVDLFFERPWYLEEPQNLEPDKCDQLDWFPLTELPVNTVEYVRRAIGHYLISDRYSELGWDSPCPQCGSGGHG